MYSLMFMCAQVYSSYRFLLTACSRVACSNSSVVTLLTAQLPPTTVALPTLTVLGTCVIWWLHVFLVHALVLASVSINICCSIYSYSRGLIWDLKLDVCLSDCMLRYRDRQNTGRLDRPSRIKRCAGALLGVDVIHT